MDIERGLKKIENWYGVLVCAGIVFAILTFVLYAGLNGPHNDYVHAVARFWVSFSMTVFFTVLSITVKKIHKFLKLLQNGK